jgi:hypothetical protein
MEQKEASPHRSLVALRRVSKVTDCKTASSLFRPSADSPRSLSSPLSRGNSRRGSLSSLLGVPFSPPQSPAPPLHRKHRTDSSGHPHGGAGSDDFTAVSHHSSIAEEDEGEGEGEDREGEEGEKGKEMETEEVVNQFRSEYFAPRTQPAAFGELQRGDSRTYGELETLLLSRIESYAEFNYIEEPAAAVDQEGDHQEEEREREGILRQDSLSSEAYGLDDQEEQERSRRGGMELSVKEKRFRLSREGELLVEDEETGEFVKATKNFSLYSDMITDQELRLLQETYQQQLPFSPATAASTSASTSSPSASPLTVSSVGARPRAGAQQQTPQKQRQMQQRPQGLELTAVDMLSPSRVHFDLTTAKQRVAIDMKEQAERQRLLEKHHDFVETLCRITELKSQTALEERERKMKMRTAGGRGGAGRGKGGWQEEGAGEGEEDDARSHSHAVAIGRIFDVK